MDYLCYDIRMNQKLFMLSLTLSVALLNCGMSGKEMETAKKHFSDAATKQCECTKIKTSADFNQEAFAQCTREYEDIVRYMNAFFDVVKPSDAEKKEAASVAESIQQNCK